jgi:hypothetical protein
MFAEKLKEGHYAVNSFMMPTAQIIRGSSYNKRLPGRGNERWRAHCRMGNEARLESPLPCLIIVITFQGNLDSSGMEKLHFEGVLDHKLHIGEHVESKLFPTQQKCAA